MGKGAEAGPHLLERGRLGALEAEDRLLHVADGEQGARLGAGALAMEEFLRQGADHRPLRAAGVLGLVDQHMVDAAIQLVMDPAAAGRRGWSSGTLELRSLDHRLPGFARDSDTRAIMAAGWRKIHAGGDFRAGTTVAR